MGKYCLKSPLVFSLDPRLLEVIEKLIGGQPFLFKDKLLYKLQGDTGYGLHQDFAYYNLDLSAKDRMVTIAIAIDDISQADGSLSFVLSRHDKVQPPPPDKPKDVERAAMTGGETLGSFASPRKHYCVSLAYAAQQRSELLAICPPCALSDIYASGFGASAR